MSKPDDELLAKLRNAWHEDWKTNLQHLCDLAAQRIDALNKALDETTDEVQHILGDIVSARASNVIGSGDSRFDEASNQELARLEAMLSRARAARSISSVQSSPMETKP